MKIFSNVLTLLAVTLFYICLDGRFVYICIYFLPYLLLACDVMVSCVLFLVNYVVDHQFLPEGL